MLSSLFGLILLDTTIAIPLAANSAKAVLMPQNSVVHISIIDITPSHIL